MLIWSFSLPSTVWQAFWSQFQGTNRSSASGESPNVFAQNSPPEVFPSGCFPSRRKNFRGRTLDVNRSSGYSGSLVQNSFPVVFSSRCFCSGEKYFRRQNIRFINTFSLRVPEVRSIILFIWNAHSRCFYLKKKMHSIDVGEMAYQFTHIYLARPSITGKKLLKVTFSVCALYVKDLGLGIKLFSRTRRPSPHLCFLSVGVGVSNFWY